MYLWLGVDVEEQLSAVKTAAQEAEEAIGFAHSNFTLPLHISLKMSFWVREDEFAAAVELFTRFFEALAPMQVGVQGVELLDGIVWIRMDEDKTLCAVHDYLTAIAKGHFGAQPHPYDGDYQFHTTLFMGEKEKLALAYERVKDVPLPKTLTLSRFVIGCSSSGELGSYQIDRRIDK